MVTTPHNHQVIIIGSGPAGLSAAVHLARAGLSPLIISGTPIGGQLIRSKSVTNWPGITAIPGAELIQQLVEHAHHHGALLMEDAVHQATLTPDTKTITLYSGATLSAPTVIIACGGKPKNLDCAGAKKYWDRGIYIGMPTTITEYTNKKVAVIGGGNSGIGVATRLLAAGAEVIIVHAKPQLAANDPAVHTVTQHPATSLALGYTPYLVEGTDTHPTHLVVQSTTANDQERHAIDMIIVTIGSSPNTDLFHGQLDLSTSGHIVVQPGTTLTNIPGVFAAGDVMDSRYRHAITSAGQGFMAGIDAENYLKNLMRASSVKAKG